jgi:hypothetical protein
MISQSAGNLFDFFLSLKSEFHLFHPDEKFFTACYRASHVALRHPDRIGTKQSTAD